MKLYAVYSKLVPPSQKTTVMIYWMNAKKKLLGGMSLNGHAIPVDGVNKGAMGMPGGCFP